MKKGIFLKFLKIRFETKSNKMDNIINTDKNKVPIWVVKDKIRGIIINANLNRLDLLIINFLKLEFFLIRLIVKDKKRKLKEVANPYLIILNILSCIDCAGRIRKNPLIMAKPHWGRIKNKELKYIKIIKKGSNILTVKSYPKLEKLNKFNIIEKEGSFPISLPLSRAFIQFL